MALPSGTYPVLGKLDAKRFTSLLSTAEIAIGTALVLPMVPAWLAGTGLTAFALGTLGLYLRTPGMRQDGSLRPDSAGHPPGQGRLDGGHRTRPHGRRGR